jgi:hypothetical protein
MPRINPYRPGTLAFNTFNAQQQGEINPPPDILALLQAETTRANKDHAANFRRAHTELAKLLFLGAQLLAADDGATADPGSRAHRAYIDARRLFEDQLERLTV